MVLARPPRFGLGREKDTFFEQLNASIFWLNALGRLGIQANRAVDDANPGHR
jgi:hypothetical protein